MKLLYPLISLFISVSVCAQQGVTIGSGNPPDPSAVLDLQSTTGGLLLPRMTAQDRNGIQTPTLGLMIFNTTSGCYEAYFTNGWRALDCNCNSFPSGNFTVSSATPGTGQVVNVSPASPLPGETYQWTFQNGNPASSNQQNASTQWSSPGTYMIIFTATNNQGCAITDTQTVTVTSCAGPQSQTTTFSYTGSQQIWTVPPAVCSITIQCWGAQGSNGSSPGANGGLASGTATVVPGETLYVFVGGQAGYNGGGTGNTGGGNGGGASDVRRLGNTLTDRIIVAGGGGGGGATNGGAPGGTGGGGTCASNYCGGSGGKGANGLAPPVGGANGGNTGGAGGVGNGGNNGGAGGGGGFVSGGGGGTNSGYISGTAGVLGIGGNGGGPTGAGAGGGGYYGGGGASGGVNSNAGGGGGSSWTGNLTSPTMTAGVRTGNGQVTISW